MQPPEAAESDGLSVDLEVDDLVRAEADAEEERLLRLMAPAPKVQLFRNVYGVPVRLRELTPEDVQRLRERGSMTADEVREWRAGASSTRTGRALPQLLPQRNGRPAGRPKLLISMVGARGFEPPTSWSRTKRSSQAEPRPDRRKT
jgi:hypothetical protein